MRIFFFFLLSQILMADNLSFFLSTSEKIFFPDQEIKINLKIKNEGKDTEKIEIYYLHPKEKNFLFVGEKYILNVLANNEKIENFTNHMPPEPKPGIVPFFLKPKQELNLFIPFPWYYYPIELPCVFKISLKYEDIISNEIEFKVLSREWKLNNNLIINGDFKEGEKFPYGWIIENENIKWEEKDFICFNLDKSVAEGEGMWIYSIFNNIEDGEYNLFLRFKSSAPSVIIFVEGWGIVEGRKRKIERNECFPYFKDNDWNEFNFNVLFKNENVRWFRVKIYCYLKPGKVWFDKIQLKKK